MKPKLLLLVVSLVGNFATLALSADEVDLQNGDRYFGTVMTVTADTVVLDGEVLGKITVPRQKVAKLTFATNAPAAAAAPTNGIRLVGPPQLPSVTETNAALTALLRAPGTNLNSIAQIREQMLGGSPAALGKFNEIVGGMMSGKMDMAGLRREAKASADQLRALKRDLGPEGGESLDYYLEVLDNFLKAEPAPPGSQPKTPAP